MNLVELIGCLDLTSLNENDTHESITTLCQKAITPLGSVAAICVYPQFVSHAWKQLMETSIKVATVANFPSGNESLDKVTQTIQQAILDGASEIDVVIPAKGIHAFVSHCKNLCDTKALLKVILETGNKSHQEIEDLSYHAIEAGADFLKTSTGKIPVGATPDAARCILEVIKNSQKPVGFKASGGVKKLTQAKIYSDLTRSILSLKTLSPSRFRIGASSLLEEILCLSQNPN